jgi:hypothetical protein
MTLSLSSIPRKEPAVIIGGLLSLVTAAADALADNPSVNTWNVALPIIVGAVLRFFVVSPATHTTAQNEAFEAGVTSGKAKAARAAKAKTKKTKTTKAAKTTAGE